jgi:hypothetical protein
MLHSLVGHLEAILAACTTLSTLEQTADPHRRLRLEFSAIAHVLQVRHDMQETALGDDALASQLRLFIAVTDCFEDAASVRSSLRRDTAARDLIGGRIPVATLVALAVAMRDVLGIWYGVDDDARDARAEPPRAPLSEALVWATSPDVA